MPSGRKSSPVKRSWQFQGFFSGRVRTSTAKGPSSRPRLILVCSSCGQLAGPPLVSGDSGWAQDGWKLIVYLVGLLRTFEGTVSDDQRQRFSGRNSKSQTVINKDPFTILKVVGCLDEQRLGGVGEFLLMHQPGVEFFFQCGVRNYISFRQLPVGDQFFRGT